MVASSEDYEGIKLRLDQIVEAVSNPELGLDDALRLYEEAVGLGLAATELLGKDVSASSEPDMEDEDKQPTAGMVDAPSAS